MHLLVSNMGHAPSACVHLLVADMARLLACVHLLVTNMGAIIYHAVGNYHLPDGRKLSST